MVRQKNKYPYFYQVYVSLLRDGVVSDLKRNKLLHKRLGIYKNTFINWCANQRVNYNHDILDEVEEFLTKYLKKRMYNFDLPLWRKITKRVFERDSYTCSYCLQKGGELEVDHIIPLSKGGTNALSNLTTSCRKCNRQKRDKTPEEFDIWRQRRNAR